MITINIYYTGKNGNARKLANEMISSRIVKTIRNLLLRHIQHCSTIFAFRIILNKKIKKIYKMR